MLGVILFIRCWLMLMVMGSTFAYVVPRQSSRSSATQLHWFGKQQNTKQLAKKTSPAQKKAAASVEEKVKIPKRQSSPAQKKTAASVEEPKREPFIFLYGKPQWDWATGKPIGKDSWVNKRRKNWLAKPKKET